MKLTTNFAKVCSENGDSITKKLFEQIIDEEQEHLNYFDNVAGHIETFRECLPARIAGTSASTGGTSKSFVNKENKLISNDSDAKRIYCKNCINYYITWDKKFPHGCKLWGIKSMQMPHWLCTVQGQHM